ncbi:hypothetical protein DM02DRAFT_412924 [Periconia macrospinosa]|uniref:Uncharacterized protein n=1 Tax=Periconia macrospinosa TaxID=97972 RepID=A0A2V1DNW5_9PLEO|nr:hypothetical protein DM02DRAFT_412924 [Periconia macrospinosa]
MFSFLENASIDRYPTVWTGKMSIWRWLVYYACVYFTSLLWSLLGVIYHTIHSWRYASCL